MTYIVSIVIFVAAIFCSFKLAKEKRQNHIVWPVLTAVLGPAIFIIQYLATTIVKKQII